MTRCSVPLKRSAWSVVFAGLMSAAGCTGPSPAASAPPPAAAPTAPATTNATGKIERLDPAFDAIVARAAAIEKVAGGFKFTEGPVWRPGGTLSFRHVQGNL